VEEFEKPPPPPIVAQLHKPPKKRKPLIAVERDPPVVVPPIILQSLQRRGTDPGDTYLEAPPIAPESAEEIMRHLNWASRDLAIRKRRDEIARKSQKNTAHGPIDIRPRALIFL
jgi:hypothetical protein